VKYFLLFFLLAFSLSLEAKVVEKEVSGFGLNQQRAISNALLEAVSQVNGVSVDSISLMRSRLIEINFHYDKKSGKATYHDQGGATVLQITNGIVQGYDVVKISKVDNGYKAIVNVKISQYEAADSSYKNRKKLAIMPFYMYQHSYKIGRRSYGNIVLTDYISDALTTAFVQSKKVAVVDRSYTYDMAKELNLIRSQEAPLREKVKLGQKLGADYILVGTIKKATLNRETKYNQSLGTSDSSDSVNFIIDYRLIVVGTSHIKFSQSVTMKIDVTESENIVEEAISKISHEITNTILNDMYPIRIAQITASKEIILNQGGNTMHVGMKMQVMKLGEEIIDTYTKESLGRSETKVAEIEITKVTSSMSYAKITEGTISLVHQNDICRRIKTSTAPKKVEDNPNWKKTNVEVNDGGGVRLGF